VAWEPPSIPGYSGNGGLSLTTIRPHRTSAIFQARQRLRPEPLAALFDGVAKPLGRPAMSAVWLAGRRLVAIDGSWLVAADGVKNSVFLGARVNNSEKPAFRQACTPDNLQRHSGWEYGHVLSGKLDCRAIRAHELVGSARGNGMSALRVFGLDGRPIPRKWTRLSVM